LLEYLVNKTPFGGPVPKKIAFVVRDEDPVNPWLSSFQSESKVQQENAEHDCHEPDDDDEEFSRRERVEKEENAEKHCQGAVEYEKLFAGKRSFKVHDYKKLEATDQKAPYADDDYKYFQCLLCVNDDQDAKCDTDQALDEGAHIGFLCFGISNRYKQQNQAPQKDDKSEIFP